MITPAAGSRISASQIDQLLGAAIIKGADQQALNSTTLQADNALALPVVANASYWFECYLDYEGATRGNGDLKWNWALPSLATLRYQPIYSDTNGTSQTGLTMTGSTVVSAGTSGAGTLRGATMTGTLVTSSNGGNLTLMWAQNTANSSVATIIHAQSGLALWRVS